MTDNDKLWYRSLQLDLGTDIEKLCEKYHNGLWYLRIQIELGFNTIELDKYIPSNRYVIWKIIYDIVKVDGWDLLLHKVLDGELFNNYQLLEQHRIPLAYTAFENGADISKLSLKYISEAKSLELIWRCRNGLVDEVSKLLLNPQLDPNFFTRNSCIRCAISNYNSCYALFTAWEYNNIDVVKLLLKDYRINPNDYNLNKELIVLACEKGQKEFVQLLVDDGRIDPSYSLYGNPQTKSLKRFRPLRFAVIECINIKRPDILRILLTDNRVRNSIDIGKLMHAMIFDNIECVKVFIESGLFNLKYYSEILMSKLIIIRNIYCEAEFKNAALASVLLSNPDIQQGLSEELLIKYESYLGG